MCNVWNISCSIPFKHMLAGRMQAYSERIMLLGCCHCADVCYEVFCSRLMTVVLRGVCV